MDGTIMIKNNNDFVHRVTIEAALVSYITPRQERPVGETGNMDKLFLTIWSSLLLYVLSEYILLLSVSINLDNVITCTTLIIKI